jgi:hypothetical protein
VGRRHRRREERDGVRRHRIRVVRLLRRQPSRRQSVCELRARARRADRPAHLAFSRHPPRRVGLGLPRRAKPGHGEAPRPQHRRGRADYEVRLRVRARSAHRRLAVSDSTTEGPAVAGRGRAARRDAAVPGEAAAVHATRSHRGHAHHPDAGRARGGPAAIPPVRRRHVRATDRARRHRLSRIRRRRGVGRRRVRSRQRAALRQLERDALDRAADPEQRHLALQRELRDLSSRGSQGIAGGARARRLRR